jgi:hypothetical protein
MNEAIKADMEARARNAVLAMDGLVELYENQAMGWTPSAEITAALMRCVFEQAKSAIPHQREHFSSNDDD